MQIPESIGGPKIAVPNNVGNSLSFNAQSRSPQTIEISNPAAVTKQWTTNAIPHWLQLNPRSGQVSGKGKESLNVSVDKTNLQPGTYKAEVIFNWTGEGPGDRLEVTLVV